MTEGAGLRHGAWLAVGRVWGRVAAVWRPVMGYQVLWSSQDSSRGSEAGRPRWCLPCGHQTEVEVSELRRQKLEVD